MVSQSVNHEGHEVSRRKPCPDLVISCSLWLIVNRGRSRTTLQRVHVGQHVIDLLLGKHIAERLHFASAKTDNISDTGVVRTDSTDGQILLLEHAFQPRPLPPASGIRCVAAVAILVVKAASGTLLRVEAKLGVTFSSFNFAAAQREQSKRQA